MENHQKKVLALDRPEERLRLKLTKTHPYLHVHQGLWYLFRTTRGPGSPPSVLVRPNHDLATSLSGTRGKQRSVDPSLVYTGLWIARRLSWQGIRCLLPTTRTSPPATKGARELNASASRVMPSPLRALPLLTRKRYSAMNPRSRPWPGLEPDARDRPVVSSWHFSCLIRNRNYEGAARAARSLINFQRGILSRLLWSAQVTSP